MAVALVGWLVWAVLSGATVKSAVAELGRGLLYAGLIAFLLTLSR